MIEFPYGIADFQSIRRDGMVYVDRTAYIRQVERLGRVLVFLRPRRFGKSLWLRTLATYYDLRHAGDFDQIFGGLDIAREPTRLANRFFVLSWNFSRVTPRGGVDRIAESLRDHVLSRVKTFVRDYRDHLPSPVQTEGSSETVLDSLLSVIRACWSSLCPTSATAPGHGRSPWVSSATATSSHCSPSSRRSSCRCSRTATAARLLVGRA